MFDESGRVTECFAASHYSRNRVSAGWLARIAMNFHAARNFHRDTCIVNAKIDHPENALNCAESCDAVEYVK